MTLQKQDFIIGRLRNLELQQISTWWDCLFYFGILLSLLVINKFIIFLGCFVFIFSIIQVCEYLNKRELIKKYNEIKKQ